MNLRHISWHDAGPLAWNELVESSDEAWLFHRYEFMEVFSTWRGVINRSFALSDPEQKDTLVAIIPAYQHDLHALDSMGSPIVTPSIIGKRRQTILTYAHDRLYTIAKENSVNVVRSSLLPSTPCIRFIACPRVNPLLSYGYTNTLTQTYTIDLQQPLENIWNNLKPYCRTHIRKAEKEGCTVRLAEATEQDLTTYYDLHVTTYTRTGVTPHPRAYFEGIWKHFVATGRALVFFAEKDGKVLAADNEAWYKKSMSGWTAAGLPEAAQIGANNLLHWTAIQYAHANGGVFYESGEAFPGAKDGKEKGLNDFKKSFGGELYPLYRGEKMVNLSHSSFTQNVSLYTRLIRKLAKIAKKILRV
jgi:hypothetical protein